MRHQNTQITTKTIYFLNSLCFIWFLQRFVNTILADELWIAYGTGKLLHNLPVHTIVLSLGQETS